MTYYKYPVIDKDDDSLVDLANNMGIEDLCKLINIFQDRICVFDVKNKIVHELRDTTEYFSAALNGAGIQLSVNDEGEEHKDDNGEWYGGYNDRTTKT